MNKNEVDSTLAWLENRLLLVEETQTILYKVAGSLRASILRGEGAAGAEKLADWFQSQAMALIPFVSGLNHVPAAQEASAPAPVPTPVPTDSKLN
jgi:hypothetical protein